MIAPVLRLPQAQHSHFYAFPGGRAWTSNGVLEGAVHCPERLLVGHIVTVEGSKSNHFIDFKTWESVPVVLAFLLWFLGVEGFKLNGLTGVLFQQKST